MSYGMQRLPPPDAGRYVTYCHRIYEVTDDGMGPGMAGMIGGIITGVFTPFLFVDGYPVWGTICAILFMLLMVFGLAPLLVVRVRGFEVNDQYTVGHDRIQAGTVWRDYRQCKEPALRSAADPLWRSYLVAMQAYSIGHDYTHLRQANERAKRLDQLEREQRHIDQARALAKAGPGLNDTDDIERADEFLKALKELPYE